MTDHAMHDAYEQVRHRLRCLVCDGEPESYRCPVCVKRIDALVAAVLASARERVEALVKPAYDSDSNSLWRAEDRAYNAALDAAARAITEAT